MKLLHKMMLNLLLVAIPVALGGVWLFYSFIHAGIQYEVDEQLSSDLESIRYQWQHPGSDTRRIASSRIEITRTGMPILPTYSDTLGLDRREKILVPMRQLTATIKTAPGVQYRVVIRQPMGEFDEIARLLSIGVAATFVVLMAALMVLNGWLIRRLWHPFYRLIDQLRQYRLDSTGNPQPVMTFPQSTTDEFNQLSSALNTMSRNLQEQFRAQQQFTDNAAHEMQTPLSIVGHELENLLAIDPLNAEQVIGIERAQDSIRRLVRLNKSLLLLTRIENHQFVGEHINISRIVDELAQTYHDFARHHGLRWECRLTPDVYQTMNPYLAEVLVSNLLQNAIRYSEPASRVEITLTPSCFMIQNQGEALPFPAHQLFDRFRKHPAHPDSTGLGLALVQQIAHLYGIAVHYFYQTDTRLHVFRLDLPQPAPTVGFNTV
ncbi:HAMP domain-containing sensor histidine kinase [Larkinella knui]|uniref:histidine kinase n=1 Tax=Larkinella knui TaxID=2025310 RepID=A0A3P1CLF4_9BACT|nr:ATP-binding protein [Larkinella knui]RRB13744.1 HAMP domain-containing protein [Larkinella knui]